jgi:hypothetical protein
MPAASSALGPEQSLRWLGRRKQEGDMRKLLLASVATLGTASLMGAAFAQTATTPVVGAPSQGQQAWPLANPTAFVNNNNNYQAPAIPGPLANPTPGTIVIHINGKVQTEFETNWTNQDSRFATAPAAGSFSAGQGVNGTGQVKLEPITINAFMRLYFGADAMATNGLRYGAAIELRQNFAGAISSNSSSNASTYSSTSSVYVRRAFTYVAGENWGILRVGQADGIIGIFDNGVTTSQWGIIGEFNGGDGQNMAGNAVPTFWFLSQAGNEYFPNKVVYLSPQFAGFDLGFNYSPTTSSGYAGYSTWGQVGTSLDGSGIGTGNSCSVANTGCGNLSSSPGIQDGGRYLNLVGAGVRYQGKFGPVGILAYGAYEASEHVNYTGSQTPATLGTSALTVGGVPGAPVASTFTGKYQGLSFGSGGVAVTFAGITLNGNVIGGKINGQLGLVPDGGSNELAYVIGAKYVTGPWTMGIAGEIGWYQGNPVLSGISQRRGRGLVAGVQYTVAPGFQVAAEYLWNDVQQSATNFVGGTVSTAPAAQNIGNNAHGQAFVLGNVVNF